MPRTTKHLKAHQFKPGQTGNPKGRPKNPIPDILKKVTKQSLRRIVRMVVKGNVDHLEKVAKDPKTSALEVAMAVCFSKAIARGDYTTVEHMLQRIVGKVPDEVNLNSTNVNRNINVNAKVRRDKIKEVMKELEEEI